MIGTTVAGAEAALVVSWLAAVEVHTTEGERLRVLYRGRRHGDGPDFKGAVLASDDDALVCGDVELHTTARCWQQHGHHRDPAYNGVVLHVVAVADGGAAVRADGRTVPLAVIASSEAALRQPNACAAALSRLGPQTLGERLEVAGERRFRAKAVAFAAAIAAGDGEQALYAGLMDALGYGRNRNRDAFRELAVRLPWAVLRDLLADKSPAAARLRRATTALLGMAGLLMTPPDPLGARLDGALGGEWWRRSGLRPCNRPERRLRAAAVLLARYGDGLVDGLMDLLADPAEGVPRRLRQGLVVGDGRGPALIGRGRAADIAVNVVLPFGYAWGEATDDALLARNAGAAYAAHGPADDNAVLAHMRRQLGIEVALAATARRQQGLLHLQFDYCTRGRCPACPLS